MSESLSNDNYRYHHLIPIAESLIRREFGRCNKETMFGLDSALHLIAIYLEAFEKQYVSWDYTLSQIEAEFQTLRKKMKIAKDVGWRPKVSVIKV